MDELQTAFVEADRASSEGEPTKSIRDSLWSSCLDARQEMRRRVLAEDLELAYVDLYGYDDRIRELYDSCTEALRFLSEEAFDIITNGTQELVIRQERGHASSVLGNKLRLCVATVRTAFRDDAAQIVGGLRAEILGLLQAKDRDVVDRTALGPQFGGIATPRRTGLQLRIVEQSIPTDSQPEALERCIFCDLPEGPEGRQDGALRPSSDGHVHPDKRTVDLTEAAGLEDSTTWDAVPIRSTSRKLLEALRSAGETYQREESDSLSLQRCDFVRPDDRFAAMTKRLRQMAADDTIARNNERAD